MDDVFLAMKRDYLSIVGGVVGQITMPKEERMVRRAVDEAITAADRLFGEVLDGDLEDLKATFSVPEDESVKDEPKDDSMFTDNDDDGEEEDADETADENDDDDDDDDIDDAVMNDTDNAVAADESTGDVSPAAPMIDDV